MVQAELGGGPAHLGVAEAEAAAAAGRVVGLQVKGPRATPEMRGQPCPQATCTGGVQGIPAGLMQAQNHQGDFKKSLFQIYRRVAKPVSSTRASPKVN